MARTPQLIVFDLDFTLWDCGGTWCDCLSPPFSGQGERVVDRDGRCIRLYEAVMPVLDHCDQQSIPMALASRTEQPRWARQLLALLGIAKRFQHSEIYPSSKLRHFEALHEASSVTMDQMIFFDDEMRNIREVGTLGVQCEFVEDGLTRSQFEQALKTFARPN
ncbi:MAG: magnesium-dependent phosphatase-1 [Planctomycetota bacterium]